MKKYILPSIILFVLALSFTVFALSNGNLLSDYGIINKQSTEAGYRLNDNILRQEVIKMAIKLNGKTVPSNYVCKGYYGDLSKTEPNNWACGVVEIAADNGLISRSNSLFRPEDNITRAEALKIFMNAANMNTGTTVYTTKFADISESWQIKIYYNAIKLGLLDVTSKYNPNQDSIRGEVFEIVKRIIEKTKDKTITCTSDEYKTGNTCKNKYITINYNGVSLKAIIDKPEDIGDEVDVLLAYHGTTSADTEIVKATKTTIEKTRNILTAKNIMIIGVVYPEEGKLIGDNIKEAEAALLWTKNNASQEMGLKINKIFMIGHSQGGYLVTRLNTMYSTDGVIANGPGPIDISIKCIAEEKGMVQPSTHCNLLYKEYGSAITNPKPYTDRSMINFALGLKSKILFIQGLDDTKLQVTELQKYKEKLSQCTNCANYKFLELENSGHGAAFENQDAMNAINDFLIK